MKSHDIHVTKTDSKTKIKGENYSSGDANDFIPLKTSQFNMQTLERSFTDRVHREVNNIFATVDNKVHDAILAALIGKHTLISIQSQYQEQKLEYRLYGFEVFSQISNTFLLDPERIEWL